MLGQGKPQESQYRLAPSSISISAGIQQTEEQTPAFKEQSPTLTTKHVKQGALALEFGSWAKRAVVLRGSAPISQAFSELGWGPGANYSCAVLPQPKEGHLVRSYGPVVDKPLRGGDWTGVLSSNDACGLSHSHPKWWPDSAWPGREEIHIETTAIRE
ncbi:hypothetical protein Sjap_026653 [Stephania japonica]|uniref:Uncharacterized protein n=1 Tax=Stephania japonica TaxID=461633 RepID=A0AAP0DUQ8_9MAGN